MQSNIRSSNSRNVDFERHHISYSDIDTDSLSTCIGLLLDGSIGNQSFCFLSHSSKIDEYKDDDLKYLLVRLLAKLAYCLKKDFGMNSSLESYAVNNLKLLIVGGAIDEHILTRKAFSLMNADVELRVIRQITNDDDVIYLFKKLKNSVKIIEPVTYVTPTHDEHAGE
jgi:hypothetical protein